MNFIDLLWQLACALMIAGVVALIILFMMGSMKVSSDVDRRTGHDELDDDQWK